MFPVANLNAVGCVLFVSPKHKRLKGREGASSGGQLLQIVISVGIFIGGGAQLHLLQKIAVVAGADNVEAVWFAEAFNFP